MNEHWKRSLTKAISYRLIIIVCDVTAIYLFTGNLNIALGFMIISNVYTSVAYYFHERAWNKIGWGKTENKEQKNVTINVTK